MSLVDPIAHLAQVEIGEANRLLVCWGHRMGACNRPNAALWAHCLFHNGDPIAVTFTASLVRQTCAGLTRTEAVELARLCAVRPGLCRLMLRSWREFIFEPLRQQRGWQWAVSYQDEALHSGDTYRFDGWVKLARSRSGTDTRGGRKGRNKTIWGWTDDPVERALRRAAPSSNAPAIYGDEALSGNVTAFVSPGSGVFGPLAGIPPATLQLWLNDAVTARHALMTQTLVTATLYSAGEGSRSATFARTSLPNLNAYIGELQQALGHPGGRRRAIVVRV